MAVQNGKAAALSERAAQEGREGKRSGERLRSAIKDGPGERRGGVAGAVNISVNGFNAIEDGPA
jgi:hypothetical protein